MEASPSRQVFRRPTVRARSTSLAVSISKPAVSQHLSVLGAAGLVTSEKKNQFVHYSLVRESLVNTLNDYVQEVCPVSRPLKAESAAMKRKTEG